MITTGVSGWMFLLVLAHPGCPGQNPESHKMVVWVCVCLSVNRPNSMPTILLTKSTIMQNLPFLT